MQSCEAHQGSCGLLFLCIPMYCIVFPVLVEDLAPQQAKICSTHVALRTSRVSHSVILQLVLPGATVMILMALFCITSTTLHCCVGTERQESGSCIQLVSGQPGHIRAAALSTRPLCI